MQTARLRGAAAGFDLANLVVAALLFVSPWLLGYAAETAAAWNAWITGLAIAGFGLAALVRFHEWEEWVNVLLGLWAAISPWLLGFVANGPARWAHVVAGLVVMGLAAIDLWLGRQSPPAKPA